MKNSLTSLLSRAEAEKKQTLKPKEKFANALKNIMKTAEQKKRRSEYFINRKIKTTPEKVSKIFAYFKIPSTYHFTKKVFTLQMLLGFNVKYCDGIYGPYTHKKALEKVGPPITETPKKENNISLVSLLSKKDRLPEVGSSREFKERNYDKYRKNLKENGGEDVERYEGPMKIYTIPNRYTGRNIKIFAPRKIPPNARAKVISYFPGSGNQRSKWNALKNGKWNRKHGLMALKRMAYEKNQYPVFVFFEGKEYWEKWKEMNKPTQFKQLMEDVRNKLVQEDVAKKLKKEQMDHYIMGHSHAFVYMQNLLKAMPKNYFSGVTVLDSIYGTKGHKNWKEWCQIMTKHNKTKFYLLASKQYQGDPNEPIHNSKRIREWFKKHPGLRSPKDTYFYKTWLTHGPIKATGIRDSMLAFLSREKERVDKK